MRGLKREERHQWHGQPGAWACKRCAYTMTGGGLDDGICPASMSGRLDFAPGGEAASPTRLDTPERVDKDARQGGLGDVFRGTGKGRQVVITEEGNSPGGDQ